MLRLVELVIDVRYYLQRAAHRGYRMPTKKTIKKKKTHVQRNSGSILLLMDIGMTNLLKTH